MRPGQMGARPRLSQGSGIKEASGSPSPELALQGEDGHVPWPKAQLHHLPHQPIWGWRGQGQSENELAVLAGTWVAGGAGRKEAQTKSYKQASL